MTERNLTLPGHLRYQPALLKPIFGYDHLYRACGEIEIANLQTLGEIGIIPEEHVVLLTPDIIERILDICTTQVDKGERATKHDIRAFVLLIKEILPEPLQKWAHVPQTSYDKLDTGRALQLKRVHAALRPQIQEMILLFCALIKAHCETIQIGRTHGQHALPITVGFWIATILDRILFNTTKMDEAALGLVGKISGAVGAYNAQVGLGFMERCGRKTYEERVLEKLGLRPAPISTQILPPEPAAYFYFAATMLSQALAQFGRDCRHLMRTEIGEIGEPFELGQTGSSTMAHKRNPIIFENLDGFGTNTLVEFNRVMLTLISEHQRDLVGSSCARYFPTILVDLAQQLSNLLRKDEKTRLSFLERIRRETDACKRNVAMSAHVVLAEPLYIALQMAGFPGDAHQFVNHVLTPRAMSERRLLIEVLEDMAADSPSLQLVLDNIPHSFVSLLHNPEGYTGHASLKALEVVDRAQQFLIQ